MAITGKIQDAAAAALSAIEEALDLNPPESGAKTGDSAKSDDAASNDAALKQKSPEAELEKAAGNPALNLQLPSRAKAGERRDQPETGAPPRVAEPPPPAASAKATAQKAAGAAKQAIPAPPPPKAPRVEPQTLPANDDRRSIGELRQTLRIAPNRTITIFTFLSIGAWAALWTLFVYFHQGDVFDDTHSFFAPRPILTLLALFAPIVFIL
jgi:hypothetical protein